MPTSLAVALSAIVAISAGIAASLALTAQPHIVETPWGQVIDAVIGVEIAISLIPPAAVIGIGLALGKAEVAFNSSLLLLLNVIGLDFIGSVLILGLRGIRERDLALEKEIRAVARKTLDIVPGFVSVGSTVDVTLLDRTSARLDIVLRRNFGGQVPDIVAKQIAADGQAATGCRSEVTVEVIPLITYSNFEAA